MKDIPEAQLGSGAIICEHVANGDPIMIARRDESVEEMDSGWQFLCERETDDFTKAKVWLLKEVLEKEPSLRDYMLLPPGSRVVRSSLNAPWEIQTIST